MFIKLQNIETIIAKNIESPKIIYIFLGHSDTVFKIIN